MPADLPPTLEEAHALIVEQSKDLHSLRNHLGACQMTLELTDRQLGEVTQLLVDVGLSRDGKAIRTIAEVRASADRILKRLGARPNPPRPRPAGARTGE